jgi:hypothetical protein
LNDGKVKDSVSRLWQTWKKFGQILGDLIGRILLTLFYFTVFMPFGIGVRLFGDRLDSKGLRPPRWLSRRTRDLLLEDARRQA